MIEKGAFREDLLYRLNLINLYIPPLRERREDIPLLTYHFLRSIGSIYRKVNITIDDDAMNWLKNQPLPGNIRQIKQIIERTILLSDKDVLMKEDFQTALEMYSESSEDERIPGVGSMTLEELEKAMILKTAKCFNGSIKKIAEALGLSRASLYRRFKKYGVRL